MINAKRAREISDSRVFEPRFQVKEKAALIEKEILHRAEQGNVSVTIPMLASEIQEAELIGYLESLNYKVRTWDHRNHYGSRAFQIHVKW